MVVGEYFTSEVTFLRRRIVVWAATTKNQDYIKLQGLKRVVTNFTHRKEFVAGNLAQYSVSCGSY